MQTDSIFSRAIAFAIIVSAFFFNKVAVADTIVITRDGKEVSIQGERLQEAQDKSILFETTDGQLHVFAASRIVSLEIEVEKPTPMTHEEVGESMLAELPVGFKILRTKHYVIAYQTELAYAKWIGDLYEKRLVPEFEKFAKKKLKYKLVPASHPLTAIVFGSRPEYTRYVQRELGNDPGPPIAYYNQMTNRVAMFDLTFDFGRGVPGDPRRLDKVLSKPAAIPMVATIIHEGTHQLMYNRGMQTRFADGPVWLNEGMANWFEAPDLRNAKGWRRPGMMNDLRLRQLKKYLPVRPADSLETLVSSDDRFSGEGVLDAYAESWALVHFLIRHRKVEFQRYIEELSKKQPGFVVDPEERLKAFRKHFGDKNKKRLGDLAKLEKAFQNYMRSLK